jgi:tRNA threonylcarbamoyladenosine biosynthesis protein TsaE
MTARRRRVITGSTEQTRDLGRRVGETVAGGVVIALEGALGSGKTVFVQGLAQGLGVPAEYAVTSPSYTLVNEYPGRWRLFHVDLYRLEDPALFEEIGLFDILADDGVTAVEWAERLPPGLLQDRLRVRISIMPDERRQFELAAYGQKSDDLLRGLPAFDHRKPRGILEGDR